MACFMRAQVLIQMGLKCACYVLRLKAVFSRLRVHQIKTAVEHGDLGILFL
jgi:hypothetical protein